MLDVKGTKTEENLRKAFAGESEARNRYTYYADQARKEGYEQIANIFEKTAGNEREHARLWYKLLNGGIGTTEENIQNALGGEQIEADDTYLEYAKDARAEGLDEIAELFEGVAAIEAEHNKMFIKLLDNVQNGSVFKKNGEEKWECLVCGYTVTGTEPPEICPVCGFGRSVFEISKDNY